MADFFADLLPAQPSPPHNGANADDVLVSSPKAASDASGTPARSSSVAAMSGLPMVRV